MLLMIPVRTRQSAATAALLLGLLLWPPSVQAGPDGRPGPVAAGVAADLVGSFTGGASGPIGIQQDWVFKADGTYDMTGYPSIGETGRWEEAARTAGKVTLRLHDRKTCGPCEGNPRRLAAAEERREEVELLETVGPGRGKVSRIRLRNLTFNRKP